MKKNILFLSGCLAASVILLGTTRTVAVSINENQSTTSAKKNPPKNAAPKDNSRVETTTPGANTGHSTNNGNPSTTGHSSTTGQTGAAQKNNTSDEKAPAPSGGGGMPGHSTKSGQAEGTKDQGTGNNTTGEGSTGASGAGGKSTSSTK